MVEKNFFWLLDVSTVNSFLLYNMEQQNLGKTMITSKQFREKLIQGLVGEIRNREKRKRGRPSSADEEERLNGLTHFIDQSKTKKQKQCMVCSNRSAGIRKETVFFCDTCEKKPGLHPGECFKRYHTLKIYKSC